MSENHNSEKKGTQKKQYDSPNYKNCGRKHDQKMKPFIIYSLFWKITDENHVISARHINDLLDNYYISSERRSIYRDIKEINRVLFALEEETGITFADYELDEDDSNELKSIIYDPHRKGYYLQHRPFDFNDIQTLAQCICSSKFVSKNKSKYLIDMMCKFVSQHQAEQIQQTSFLTDYEKTNSSSVLYSISTINDAMSSNLNGLSHIEEKVTFDYLEYAIDELKHKPILQSSGRKTVSPYQLLTKNGDIYLLSYDDSLGKMMTYKVSRMVNVSLTGEARTGELVFKSMDLNEYFRRGFIEYEREPQHVSIEFQNKHFEAAIAYLGIEKARYSTADNDGFIVDVNVEINPAFYNWLLNFGPEAKILKPDWAIEAFLKHIDKIKNTYNDKQ